MAFPKISEFDYYSRDVYDIDGPATLVVGSGSVNPSPPVPCALELSFNPLRKINVRCRCMAQRVIRHGKRFFNYDTLGVATTTDEIQAIWKEHLRKKEEK